MNKAFEKILERLDDGVSIPKMNGMEIRVGKMQTQGFGIGVLFAKEIVKEVAKEYKGGWIQCGERLPEDDSICMVTVEYPNNETVVDYGWFDRKSVCWFVGMQEFRTSNILAWQPLPEPFKERD